jgi:Putative zinc-finger
MTMNCEQISEFLPDYLQGSLTGEPARQVEDHLLHCSTCSADVALWKKLAQLPAEQPSPESRARFEAMLHAYQVGNLGAAEHTTPRASSALAPRVSPLSAAFHWLRSPLGAFAWSLALLILGIFVGSRLTTATSSHSQELAAMHSELANMRQLVALSLLQQQSASERLQGVNFTSREDQLDPQVLAALLHTLRYDTSVDVRLAALDALSRRASQPQIRKSVLDSLQQQQSPLVQVALIDLLTEWRDPEAAQQLRTLEQSPNLNPTVRQRAQWAVSKLQ